MILRPAEAADCPLLAAIDAAGNPAPWSAAQFQTALASAHNRIVLAERNGEPVGFAVWQTVCGESELHLIATAPHARRQGIARYLMAAWLEAAQQAQCSRLFLEVRRHNPAAQALYRQHGFSECGLRRDYYRLPDGSREDAVLMERIC